MAQGVKNLLAMQEMQADTSLIPGLGRSPGGEKAPAPIFLPGKSHGQGSLASYSSWDHNDLDMSELTEHTCM